ncbi:hypothetical protein KP509_1Z146500 [Ceratopteris richardii]|nr:hypothetical protein KP509_1Z146500 [Ceratopteris richardii]
MREARYSEGRRLLCRLRDWSGTIVEPGTLIAEMNAAAIARLILSKTLDEVAPDMPQLMRSVQSKATPTIGDFIAYLSFTDAIFKIRMKRLHRRLNTALDSILEERSHLISRLPADQLRDDFLQVLLSAKTDDSEESTLTPADIKAIMSDLFLAGIDTSASTLEWAMAELIRKKECLLKLQKELDEAHKGKSDYLTDEDVKDLPYLYNVVKEVLRLHPVVPLLVPRISSTETTVEGYFLPSGTIAFVNVWAIARDPKIWDHPEDFRPERFETSTRDMKGQDYELLPFGSGRRMCLGIRLGMSMVTVTLANLIRFFDWEPALDKGVESIDMGEANGIGSAMEHPLKCTPHIRKEFVNAFLT